MTAPVVIVGAGPTGLTAAVLLAQRGVATVVVDRYVRPWPRPRAVHLDGESARILQAAGVADGFAAVSRPATGLRLLDARLRPFAEFRRDTAPGRHGHPEANLFDQPDLEALLRARLARLPGAELRGGLEVTGVGEDPDGPVVALRDVASGRRETLRAAAVLGCDGAESTVRAAIGSRLLDLGFSQRWLVVDVRSPEPIPDAGGVDQVCDPRRAATFMRLHGDRYRWEFRLHPGERPPEVAALLAPWPGAAGGEVLRSAEYTFRAAVADRWRRGRVLLLGDAAHLTPPFVGQGLGAGLRDAHNLAWKLAAVLDGTAADADLDGYQREREPHARAVIRTAIRVGRAMTGGHGLVAALRRPVTAALLRVPGAEARALAGIPARHPAGTWVQHARGRHALPGTLCPQPLTDGRPLDDVLGPGFALVTDGPAPPALRARARALGARELTLGPADGELRAWLRAGRATAALLRPDRVVLAAE